MTRQQRTGGYRLRDNTPQATAPRDAAPVVTIVTALWNGAATLEACLKCVREQTYPHVEHVIVDGGSTDGSVEILTRHDDQIAYWVSEPDKGIYNALNKGIRLATGRHYIVLGCDDLLLPNAAESLIRHAIDDGVVYGQVRHNDVNDTAPLIRNHSAGTLIGIGAHERFGFYDESFRIAADTKFLMRARRAGRVREIADVVGVFFSENASGNYARNIREHARAMRESGAWGPLRSFVWLAPRLVRASLMRG
jgi:glycosyltransferase involved in cell wall biosynthesis